MSEMEVQDKRADEILRTIVEGVASATSGDFFRSLVRNLATALRVRYAFASEFAHENTRVRTLAFWTGDDFIDNFEYDLDGTPCEQVLHGETRQYPKGVQSLFPKDKDLVKLGAESYLAIPLIDPSGNVLGHLAVIDDKPMPSETRDMSIFKIFAARAGAELERKRVEEVLRESEQRYRDLYEEAPHAYLSVGIDGRIQRVNQHAVELFGYSRDKLTGRVVFDVAADTPAGKPKSQKVFEQFLAGKETHGEEIEFRSADGGQLWISLSVRPIRDVKGQVVASRGILVDITDRKRAEEALRESEERISRILESAMDAIITVNNKQRITLCNSATEAMFRCPTAEAIGKPFDRFLSEGFRKVLTDHIQALKRGAETKPYMWIPEGLTALRADGEEFPIEGTISQVEVAGQKLYTVILRDINERKKAEEELRQLRLENVYLQEEIKTEYNFGEIVGASATIKKVFRNVEQVAVTGSTQPRPGHSGAGSCPKPSAP